MFKKILIANRGEIACRVIKTCRRLGIKTVAIYSDADVDALHVKQADESYRVGPATPSESYLNIPRIIQIALESGSEAIHPGYGFLSENSSFVESCQNQNIIFIGPSRDAIQNMGDKVMARQLAGEAGLPLVPGTKGEISDAEAPEEAQRIGYPIMVKAADGGGGIGIRRVDSPEELESALERSRSLAQGSFGSSRMYLERLVAPAAHVEVQVMADHYGNAIHLFERDCSMQRRNQKVIEESPTARLNAKTRDKLHKSAINLVKHIGYTNAGTVEFLVDQSGDFYFLEMNTRLQVEHPVTEMITGLDLVEMQLIVAANEQLPVTQSHIQSTGHSIEIRLYPEDPATLLPVSGTVTHLDIPTESYIRLDSALFEGYEVTPHYESMLGKFIVWGENRKQAISRMYEALGLLQIEGLTTNTPALRAALLTEQFTKGTYTTDLFSQVVSEYQEANSKEGKLRTATLAIITAIEKLVEDKVDFGSKNIPLRSHKSNWGQASRREQLRPTYFSDGRRRS